MPKTAAEWQAENESVIAVFRKSSGGARHKNPLLLLTTTGRRTGRPLVTPLNYSEDGDRLVVIASAGGAEEHPAWFLNLVVNPEVTIERGTETFRAIASVPDEPERTRLYDQQARLMPFFDGYRRRVTRRQIPVVVFERRDR